MIKLIDLPTSQILDEPIAVIAQIGNTEFTPEEFKIKNYSKATEIINNIDLVLTVAKNEVDAGR